MHFIFWQILSVDTSPAKVVLNVPDAMATDIPPSMLLFSESTVDIDVINRKTWTRDQVSTWIIFLCTEERKVGFGFFISMLIYLD